jgi:hypothetical protein
MEQYIRVTNRTALGDKVSEQIIELGRQQPDIPALGLLLDISNNADKIAQAMAGPAAVESAPAPAAPATKLEWSHTLTDKCVDYATAEKACAALGEGWRLPTRAELESILDLTRHKPAADPERFPDMKSDWYWSSTPCAWSSDHAWCVGFGYGNVDDLRRDLSDAFARAVRAVPAGQ